MKKIKDELGLNDNLYHPGRVSRDVRVSWVNYCILARESLGGRMEYELGSLIINPFCPKTLKVGE